jgi:hypothetical protein
MNEHRIERRLYSTKCATTIYYMARCHVDTMATTNEHASSISYLILGDGDFSFSYDFARRILLESSSNSSSSPSSRTSVHLTATGIDTMLEVKSKYKDSAFLLKNSTA